MQNEFDSPDESEWDEEEPYYDWDDPDWREDWDDARCPSGRGRACRGPLSLLTELGEGVLEGGVVGRALGVLHVRHLYGGLIDHARGRVE